MSLPLTLPHVLAARHGGQPGQWQAWLRQHALPAHLAETQLSPSQRQQVATALLRHRPAFAPPRIPPSVAPAATANSSHRPANLAEWARLSVLRWVESHQPWALAESSDQALALRRDVTDRWLASGDDRPPQAVPWPDQDAELDQLRIDPAVFGLPDASLRVWALLLMLTRHRPLAQTVQRLAPCKVPRAVALGTAVAIACPDSFGVPPLVEGRVERLPGRRGDLVRASQERPRSTAKRVVAELEPAAQSAGLLQRVPPLPPQRIPLVLSASTEETLRDLALRWQHRQVVKNAGGSGGVIALMAGQSGHGRRTAARQVAEKLGMELYKVQAALLSSRWIGETEARITQMFAAAAKRGAALLVEDAQDLVTKHVELTSANDRYSNSVRNHLLQQIEAFEGLVLLVAGGPHQFDSAMQRRIHVTARFDAPDRSQRAAILLATWQWLVRRAPKLRPRHEPEMAQLAAVDAVPQQLVQAVLEAGMQASFGAGVVDDAAIQAALVRQLRRSASVTQSAVSEDRAALSLHS